MDKKWVYLFEEGRADMKNLLGGKGANLAEMTHIGLLVPPGFTITTEVCNYYTEHGEFPAGLMDDIRAALDNVEEKMGKKFGSAENPLLVSVRSGAPVSMPGMMDTILNLGLNDETVEGLAAATGNRRFAMDSYRRFLQMFGDVVEGIEHSVFEIALEEVKKAKGVSFDTELDTQALEEVISRFKAILGTKGKLVQDPQEQLEMAITAVFESWNNPRAKVYREINGIEDAMGTAVNVQSMVFGNTGDDSGTGVAFTRNPSTGAKEVYGEFLTNAQGEDVVAGIRTPLSLIKMKEVMPEIFTQLQYVFNVLERRYRDMQDLEFTIEHGTLFLLQTRNGKRTPQAALKIAVDMAKEDIITREEAIMRVEPDMLEALLHKRIDPKAEYTPLTKGLNASPGAACGKVVFDTDIAAEIGDEEDVILVRPETTPDDIHGLAKAKGVLTVRGGMTSHAAVVARGMGKPCVSGCEDIKIEGDHFVVHGVVVKEGDIITIDGGTGEVIAGELPMVEPEMSDEFSEILEWCDEASNLGVRANADTPEDARRAVEFGAQGIGLCRTEHMFMAQERLPVVQDMIMATTKEERQAALEKILPMQKEDFIGIFREMKGRPVTIRLLDPPLHEFLPDKEQLMVDVAVGKAKGDDVSDKEKILKVVESISETNPMLGFRGCRLGLIYPEIYKMQVCAIIEAAVHVREHDGLDIVPEIMIPLVGHVNELRELKKLLTEVITKIQKEHGTNMHYLFGTMIEIPRAALTADEIASEAEFFSFGTNDLTQTTFGFSRDDAEGKFLQQYVEKGILDVDPFQVLDQHGVGELMRIAIEKGKRTRPDIKLGICGEHGGEPKTIDFCYGIGLNYVSCSPFRVPIARLAAAHATIRRQV